MARPRVGIALGSGSARGWAHIGVLGALADAGIEPDIVCGTSIGAFVGGAYVTGQLDALELWVRSISWFDIVRLLDITLARGGVIEGARIFEAFRTPKSKARIEELPKPFAAVATDFASGREIWLQQGWLLGSATSVFSTSSVATRPSPKAAPASSPCCRCCSVHSGAAEERRTWPSLDNLRGSVTTIRPMITHRLYSCDDHLDLWNLPRDLWVDRLPAQLRKRAPHVAEQGGGAWWTCDGTVIGPYRLPSAYSAIGRAGIEDDGSRASDPKLRLDDLDRDGVYASVIYGPNLFGLPIADPELKAAVLAGYNDWGLEFNRHAADRLCVLPVLPTHAPEAAIAELERVAKLGHRGAIISPFEFRCSDPAWDRLWSAAEATGLPVSFHIGHGTSQVRVAPGSWELAAFAAVGPMQLDEPLAMMIYSGVLERHPGLRLVLAESGIGWLPYFVRRMDQTAEKHVSKAQDYQLKAKPSEIFRRQIYATFEEEPLGPSLLPLLGPDNFMWASDYPHPDSTFPHSRQAIAEAFAGLDAAFVEQVTATNCARLYRFA